MKNIPGWLAVTSLVLLLGCAGSPEEYRLSSQQLAWQPYQAGQLIRFAQRPAGPVRTYRISSVEDHMERQSQGINFSVFLPRKDIDCQHVVVTAQRTDTTAQQQTVLDFMLNYYAGSVSLWSTVGWEGFSAYEGIPVDSISKGAPFDSSRYQGVRLLNATTFGGTSYTSTLRIVPFISSATSVRGALRVVYYAKGTGVVAFEEIGRGLWYRVP